MARIASQLIQHVRANVQDRGGSIWSDEEILNAAHDSFGPVWDRMKLSMKDYFLDRLDVPATDFAEIGSEGVYEYSLPEQVASVRYMQSGDGTSAGGRVSIPSVAVDVGSCPHDHRPRWSWSGPNRISVHGGVARLGGVRIWYLRRTYPLHTGTAQGGSTTSIAFDSTSGRVGRLINRPNVYVGSMLEIVADTTTPANVGQRREVLSWDGSIATVLELPGPSTSGVTQYEMLTPVPDEGDNYLAWVVAEELIGRGFDTMAYGIATARKEALQEEFLDSLRARMPNETRYLQVSR